MTLNVTVFGSCETYESITGHYKFMSSHRYQLYIYAVRLSIYMLAMIHGNSFWLIDKAEQWQSVLIVN